jgi:hypothetical protein
MIGPINAFAPGDTFAVEARYLVARTECLAKMERVLTCWPPRHVGNRARLGPRVPAAWRPRMSPETR